MLWLIFWVGKVTFHSVCMYVHVILLHCFPSLVFTFNLNELWTNTFSRNYAVEFACFVFTKVAYWGQYFYVSNWRWDWHFMWSSEPCEGLAICRVRQYNTLISQLSDAEYWSDPWGWTHALYFTALNAPEPRKFVKGSKYSL